MSNLSEVNLKVTSTLTTLGKKEIQHHLKMYLLTSSVKRGSRAMKFAIVKHDAH